MGWYEFLPKLLNMSVTGAIIILAVLVVRLLLKKAPKVFSYALWSVVLFRLLCPVSFTSDLSVLKYLDVPVAENGTMEYIPVDIVHTEYPEVSLPELDFSMGNLEMNGSEGNVPADGVDTMQGNEPAESVVTDDSSKEVKFGSDTSILTKLENAINENLPQGWEQLAADPLEVPITFGTYLWGLGALALFVYNMVQLVRLRNKLQVAEPLRDNIYLADYIDTPFVMGLVRPKIYLPSALSERQRSYIILHEQYHIRRWDHVVKVLAFAALCIHWFNPLVWVAFLLATKDMEMSCDEAVMKQMKEDIRAEYAGSLLQLATGRRWLGGVTLAFGEGDTKARVKNVMHYKKPAFWLVLLAVVVCVVVAVCLVTNPEKETDLSLPFGKTFGCAELAYNGTGHSYSPSGEVYYYVTKDGRLMGKGLLHASYEATIWEDLGQFEEVKLTAKNFDFHFRTDDNILRYQVDKRMQGATVRHNVQKAWQVIGDETDVMAWNYYLLLLEGGNLGLVCWDGNDDYGVVKWMMDLEEVEPEPVDVQLGMTYKSKDCLYMNPLSSYAAIDGDSGYLYRIEEDAFVEIHKATNVETRTEIERWAWQEFPYTDEEWAELYMIDISAIKNISQYYTEMLYQPLSSRKCLMKMDEQLWLVDIANDTKAGTYIWSIYVLEPADSVTISQEPIEVVKVEPVIGETYRSSERLATAYDTNTWLLDGDSGYLYEIEENAFVIINKVDGSETRIPVEKWEWQELPFTDEEWKQIADRSVSLQDIRNRFEDVKYQPIGENASLLLLNDMMVFAEYGEFREYDFYMGDAFTLVPIESNVETAVIERIYEAEYKDSPQAAYPAKDWFTEEGRVEYPADSLILKEDSTLTERFVRFYMPREVLNEAETVELLRLSAQWPMSRYALYNYMCYYLDFLTLKFNGADELIHRSDLAEAVLAEYQADNFLPLRDLPNAKEQSEYNKLCYAQMDKIALEEILLASNRAFDQMDEDMKQAVLKEALEKVEQRQSGRFKCSDTESNTVSEFPSGFFSYILEQKEAGGSKWYQYLVETGETELVEKLDTLSPYTCRP